MATAQNRAIHSHASEMLAYSAGALVGFSVREVNGAQAVFRLRDGADTSSPDTILQTISLAPWESAREAFGDGIACKYGVYFELLSGAIEGSIQFIAGGTN